jgi:tRNA pseudouridine55 synthase
MNGVLIIDKPAGWTSHDVVNRVRRIAGERSVGHLGTLDPMATGVLPLVLGKWTRLAQFYLDAEKTYEGEIRLGFSTDTYDAEGEPTSTHVSVNLSAEQLQQAVAQLRGEFEQMPPPFSAKKIQGVPAYKLARKKEDIALRPVKVTVHEFEVSALEGEVFKFRARVAAGTYIRSLAHDLGMQLGTGGHLASLRRTRSGEFHQGDAVYLEDLKDEQAVVDKLLHPRKVLPAMPMVVANQEQMVKVRHGNSVNLPEFSQAKYVKVFAAPGELVAIASRVAGTLFHPKIVLCD